MNTWSYKYFNENTKVHNFYSVYSTSLGHFDFKFLPAILISYSRWDELDFWESLEITSFRPKRTLPQG